ncbi:hypothetical protein DMC30DRAFT_9681 [Rhodotorula diobovata]|uniref:Zn(2)-C6 fungal-type domain-containing protein n=1 Tax=Rhodotorula diobovata TaxID=5288 RepID=A0A5C5G4T6_9BASI|nr:hypothetical protein DMC30DRAFT_9681 [Rhodotorula diobovata]
MPDDTSSCSPSTSTAQPTPAAAPPPAKRISKACEPCRARRTRCDGDQPCKKCVAAGGLTCTYRTKARPMRRPRLVRPFSLAQSGGSGAADSDGVALQGLRTIEASLERQYEERTGTSISLTLPDADTHPALAPDAPLPLLPTVADSILDALCQTFVREVLVFFPFLSSTRIHQLEQRRRDMPDTLTPEQRALLYSVFAMGYLRQASSVFATDKALPVPIDPTLARLDVAYFRHAVELVQLPASPTALEALNILMLYALSTASVETTRSVLSKLCWGIHELGLHKQTTAGAYPAEFSISSTLFMSVWNDVYIAGLTGHPPFLRDVDTDLLSQSAECGGIAAPGMAQLVLLEADLLREAHQNPARLRDPAFVLAHDAKLFAFLKQYGSQTLDYTNMANVFNQTHFHFQKLLLRAPSSTDAVLGPSSLAILSRSAMHLLRHYERVFLSTRVNNCVWPVLVRTVGAGHAVLQALWHGDIVRIEAEEAMGKVMWLLDKLSTRWTVAAAAACANFTALCTALGASRTLSLSRSKTRAVSCRSLFHHADTSCTVSLPQRSTPRPA